FEVRNSAHTSIVDLESKRCTCREFDIDRIPCSPAIAASCLSNFDFYLLCSEYYSIMLWSLAYAGRIYPVPDQNECRGTCCEEKKRPKKTK
ncbi:hypothetical protein F511_29433, partial [Dorcoceras hygrometricum]